MVRFRLVHSVELNAFLPELIGSADRAYQKKKKQQKITQRTGHKNAGPSAQGSQLQIQLIPAI